MSKRQSRSTAVAQKLLQKRVMGTTARERIKKALDLGRFQKRLDRRGNNPCVERGSTDDK